MEGVRRALRMTFEYHVETVEGERMLVLDKTRGGISWLLFQ
jgi:hypothetical protein